MADSYELFEVVGVELEYMIVDRSHLNVRPLADRVLQAAAGEIVGEIDLGEISWSNELALHVIELKTTQPASSLAPLADAFCDSIANMQVYLRDLDACLLATAMHPWMDPDRELKLWPHDYNPIYEAYNRIFDCRGHGWANLQSVHLNLPFADDNQFGRLHAAIRILLPLLPALAASSPVVASALTGFADNRMRFYRHNSKRIPSLTGQVVPEAVFSRTDYARQIFQVMYQDIAPYDTDKILCHEWLNSRGAIARFERQAIEIRVLDVQEHPASDIAICEAVVAVLKLLVSERWTSYAEQQQVSTQSLAEILSQTIQQAERAEIDSPSLLRQFGLQPAPHTAQSVWQFLIEQVADQIVHIEPLRRILEHGPLARRIERALLDSANAAPHTQTQKQLKPQPPTTDDNSPSATVQSNTHSTPQPIARERLQEVYRQYCLTD